MQSQRWHYFQLYPKSFFCGLCTPTMVKHFAERKRPFCLTLQSRTIVIWLWCGIVTNHPWRFICRRRQPGLLTTRFLVNFLVPTFSSAFSYVMCRFVTQYSGIWILPYFRRKFEYFLPLLFIYYCRNFISKGRARHQLAWILNHVFDRCIFCFRNNLSHSIISRPTGIAEN